MVPAKTNSPDFLQFDPHTPHTIHCGRSIVGIKMVPDLGKHQIGDHHRIVELRGLEPLTLTLPVRFGQCPRPAETENSHVKPVAITALECQSLRFNVGSARIPAPD